MLNFLEDDSVYKFSNPVQINKTYTLKTGNYK